MNRPSRFLDDIPPECLAVRARPRAAAPVRPARGSERGRAAAPQHDEFDQRSPYDDMPEYDAYGDLEPQDEMAAGAFVEHATFGTGRVLETRGRGDQRKLVIEFPGQGIKTILARFVEPAL